MGLLSELKRRNVFRMAALYLVAAWLIMQVAGVVIDLAVLPDWTGQVVLALLTIGFPIALLFSWFYELTPEGLSLEVDVEPGESITHITGRRIDFIVIALLSAAVILFAWHTWWSPAGTNRSIEPGGVIESIAVLPLQNLSNDPAQKYFVEGMQDALITRLSRTTTLRVISKTSTLRYEETDKSIPDIARELNVDAVVEGSVLRDQDRIRITAQLIRGADDKHVWANSYDRDLNQVLALISEISLAIADEIEVTVSPQETGGWAQRDRDDFEVHELVLQGDHYFGRFKFDEGIRHYRQAVSMDADYAPAHAGVAGSYFLMGFFGYMPSSESVPIAREAALKALRLDRNSAGGYSTLGAIQLYYDRDWDLAKANLLKALELSPNDARTRHAYADYLMVMGDLEESLNQVEIGYLYDPFSPLAFLGLQGHRLLMRQYDEVIDEAREAIKKDPGLAGGLTFYRDALWLTGRYEEAFVAYKQSWGKNEELLRAMNTGFSESGYTGAVRSLANALVERNPDRVDHMTLARLYAFAGDTEAALKALEIAYQQGQPRILHVKADPVFDELRARPEFQDLIHRIGFPEAAPREKAAVGIESGTSLLADLVSFNNNPRPNKASLQSDPQESR